MGTVLITANTVGATVLSRYTLTASDTLAYIKGAGMQVTLANNTASSITATFKGSTSVASYVVPGTGGTVLSPAPSAGKDIIVAAAATTEVSLDDLDLYLQGNVTVVNGTGMTVTVISN